MPWSTDFLAGVSTASVNGLRFALRPLPAGQIYGTATLQRDWLLLSGPKAGTTADGYLAPGGEVGGSEVRAPGWESSIGAMRLPVADPSDRFMLNVRKGQWVELLCGLPGWDLARYQRVSLGVIAGANGYGTRLVLEIRDPLSGLGSRPTTTESEYALFSGTAGAQVGTAATLTADLAVADVSVSFATANFTVPTGLHGAVRIDPTTGDPFYLHIHTLTGASATVSSDSTHGTTRVDAVTGDAVTECALVEGHPAEIASRLLVSTGTASLHGPHDVMPRTWGFGLHRSLLDEADILQTVARTQPASGADDWELLSEEEQTNGVDCVAGMLRAGGYFLVLRQGSITVREARALTSAPPTVEITDADIASIDEWHPWDPDYDVQYSAIRVRCDGVDLETTGTVVTMPAENRVDYDLRDYVFANATEIGTEVRTRLKGWATQVPSRVRLMLRGWSWGFYTPGDVVAFTTRQLRGRGGVAFARTPAMVCAVSPDWMGLPQTSVVLRLLPEAGT